MKPGIVQRRIGLGCALLLAIALTVVGDDKSVQVEPAKRTATPPNEMAPPDARMGSTPADAVPDKPARIEVAKLSRVPPAADGIDVFAAKSWAMPQERRAMIPPPLPAPVAPPLPFQYVGQIQGREGPTILLSRGAESFSVRAGEPIDNDYRLESVAGDALTIVYLPLNQRQTLSQDTQ
jgi:hypothetical protein